MSADLLSQHSATDKGRCLGTSEADREAYQDQSATRVLSPLMINSTSSLPGFGVCNDMTNSTSKPETPTVYSREKAPVFQECLHGESDSVFLAGNSRLL